MKLQLVCNNTVLYQTYVWGDLHTAAVSETQARRESASVTKANSLDRSAYHNIHPGLW